MKWKCCFILVTVVFGIFFGASEVYARVILEENFDSQPDFVADDYMSGVQTALYASRGDKVPQNWDAVSAISFFDKSFLQITSANKEKARGGTGKSLVLYRGSKSGGWHGDSELAKNIHPGLDEVYVRFWIKFQPNWTSEGYSKVFRIGRSDIGTMGSNYWSYIGMGFIWDWVGDPTYGLRNHIYFHGAPGGSFNSPKIGKEPYKYNGRNVVDSNYVNAPYDLDNDGKKDNEPNLNNLVNNSVIPQYSSSVLKHNELFGSKWNRMEFYVRINSSPGVQDGILAQWFNGSLIFLNKTIPWIQSSGDPSLKFTKVKFGGNDFFHVYPDSDQHIEWYSIDDILIQDNLPDDRTLSPGDLPNPPENIIAQ